MTIPVDRHGGRLGLGGGRGDGDLVLSRGPAGRGAVGREQLLRGVTDARQEIVLRWVRFLDSLSV